MSKLKSILAILKPYFKKQIIKALLLRVGTKFAGPLGFLVGFAYDYGWKYVEKGAVFVFNKIKNTFKNVKRKRAMKKIKKAETNEDLIKAVDDFLD